MNYTTNFNLNKPEGTDLYNHLTIDNPNMDTIDAAMQANKLASVGSATELVSGNVHAITRSDSNQNIFRFKATGSFHAGDTITVDGVTVNAYTISGLPLNTNAYVLSSQVVCLLDGTSLWVLCDSNDVNNTTSETLTTGIDIVRNAKMRTLQLNITVSNSIFYTIPNASDRPKINTQALVRWRATNDTFFPALLTVSSTGDISASYIATATIAPIGDGVIVGGITYITD